MKTFFEQPPTFGPAERPESQKEPGMEKKIGFFDRFRHGRAGKIGKVLGFLAVFGAPGVIRGVSFEETDAQEQPPAVQALTREDIDGLKEQEPTMLEVTDSDIWLGYGESADDFKGENVVEKEVVTEETSEMKADIFFEWGGRKFEDAKLREAEKARLKDQLRPRIESLLGPYQEFGVSDSALKKIAVRGDVFSSPEGHQNPEANQELSEKRADLLEEVVEELLEEAGIDSSLVKVHIEGKGAQGDVLEMSRVLENLGYRFRTPEIDDNAKDPLEPRRKEMERIIRNMNEGREGAVMKRLPKDYRDAQFMRGIFENTIVSKRVGNLDFRLETKPVHIAVIKDAPAPLVRISETVFREVSRPEEFEETEQNRIIRLITQDSSTPGKEDPPEKPKEGDAPRPEEPTSEPRIPMEPSQPEEPTPETGVPPSEPDESTPESTESSTPGSPEDKPTPQPEEPSKETGIGSGTPPFDTPFSEIEFTTLDGLTGKGTDPRDLSDKDLDRLLLDISRGSSYQDELAKWLRDLMRDNKTTIVDPPWGENDNGEGDTEEPPPPPPPPPLPPKTKMPKLEAKVKALKGIGRRPIKRVQSSATHNGPVHFGPSY